MKFLFVDESHRQKDRKDRDFFSLCGVVVRRESLFDLEEDLRGIRNHHQLRTMKDLRSRGDTDFRFKVTDELCECLQNRGVSILSVVLGPQTIKRYKELHKSYLGALTLLSERFFLDLKRSSCGGMVFHDSVSDHKLEKNIKNGYYKLIAKDELRMHGKSKGSFRSHIYPTLIFLNDEHSEVLQVTDLVSTSLSYAISCEPSFEWGALDPERFPRRCEYLNKYWPLFAKSPDGKVNGWGIKIWF